jgi:catechol 2,3-dioxygenase-like lactoylglutathione lyase family enzyme
LTLAAGAVSLEQMKDLVFKAPIPILRIFDEARAKEFYVEFLGFHFDWEHRFEANFPLYLQVSRGGCVIHLSEHHGDACPGAAIKIEVDRLDDYEKALNAKAYKYSRPGIKGTPYGLREMQIADPFGNRLIFFERVA